MLVKDWFGIVRPRIPHLAPCFILVLFQDFKLQSSKNLFSRCKKAFDHFTCNILYLQLQRSQNKLGKLYLTTGKMWSIMCPTVQLLYWILFTNVSAGANFAYSLALSLGFSSSRNQCKTWDRKECVERIKFPLKNANELFVFITCFLEIGSGPRSHNSDIDLYTIFCFGF